jgi:nucleotide-binding universal stress UspA family protein
MKILVGYDGSNVAKEALRLAKTHAKAFGAEVLVVTSKEQSRELVHRKIEEAEKNLKTVVEGFFAEDEIIFETHVLSSLLTPGENLVEYAQETEVDEIIIGVRRGSKVGKLLFGSTAQYVILHAPCPVVTIK